MTAAGFNVTLKVDDATLLFETKLPKGDFQLADFAEGAILDPSPTSTFACDFIPTAGNGYAGANDFRWCDQQATTLMKQSDSELDPVKRRPGTVTSRVCPPTVIRSPSSRVRES